MYYSLFIYSYWLFIELSISENVISFQHCAAFDKVQRNVASK